MKRTDVTVPALVALSIIALMTGCWEPLCPVDEEPTAVIDKPPLQNMGTQQYARIVRFGWHVEPDCRPMWIRYMCILNTDTNDVYDPLFNTVHDLNMNPSRYEDRWSHWIPYNAPDDIGRQVTISSVTGEGAVPDGDGLEIGKTHVFAVQAKSRCDNISRVFELNVNIRRFIVSVRAGPLLTVREPYLGASRFIGTGMNPVEYNLPPGVPLNFSWQATAEAYGGEIVCYRYGWDVQDINNPDDWETACHPSVESAPERAFFSGFHTLHVEAVDHADNVTRGEIRINIIPFPMDRSLLWVDDFYATDPQPPMYETPGESNHDAFWIDICSRAGGFDPGRDVYDCFYDHNIEPPTIQEIGRYKNIIWTYSASQDAWHDIIVFTPESHITGPTTPNYLPLFLVKGGHLWTLGRSERGGGLAATWQRNMLPFWPATFEHDLSSDPTDESVFDCMGYRDYCVTAIDKIMGNFKIDEDEIPPNYYRHIDRDAMRFAYKDVADYITGQYPGLPDQLDLWEEVTKPGRFFDPTQRGFIYCEIYDPAYYMDFKNLTSQDCFHPIYRMRARSSLSFIDHQTIAIWITRYEDITPEVEAGVGVPARSVHFGFPLWFFDRAAVDQIVDVVFEEWGILAAP